MLLAISASLRFVGHGFADRALHLQLGGCAFLHDDAQADGKLAVVIGGVFRLALVGGEQFADVVEDLVLDGFCGVGLHDVLGVLGLMNGLVDQPISWMICSTMHRSRFRASFCSRVASSRQPLSRKSSHQRFP
jgi:hypothetical protein